MLIKMIRLINIYEEQHDSNSIILYDLIYCISNLLRGSQQNKEYFFNQGCLRKYFTLIFESDDLKFIQLLVQSIKEVTTLDMALQSLMQPFDIANMKSIFSKCLRLTDDWLNYMNPSNDLEIESNQKQQEINKFQSKYSVIGFENVE